MLLFGLRYRSQNYYHVYNHSTNNTHGITIGNIFKNHRFNNTTIFFNYLSKLHN